MNTDGTPNWPTVLNIPDEECTIVVPAGVWLVSTFTGKMELTTAGYIYFIERREVNNYNNQRRGFNIIEQHCIWVAGPSATIVSKQAPVDVRIITAEELSTADVEGLHYSIRL